LITLWLRVVRLAVITAVVVVLVDLEPQQLFLLPLEIHTQ
jgi:hypothetical protein